MSQDKRPTKEEIEAMLGDYQPETIEYDPKTDSKPADTPKRQTQPDASEEATSTQSDVKKLTKEEIEAMLGNYEPETVDYDPEVDGGEDHKVRDEHLKEKEMLKDVITRLKEKNRGNRKVRR